LTLIAFWRVLDCGFVFDDSEYVVNNVYIHHGVILASVKWALRHPTF